MTQDEHRVASLLAAYERTLNTSDAAGAVALYAPDGVFMPQHFPPAIGRAAVATTYRTIFATITLDVRFEIDEIRQLAPTWAFARTTSHGTLRINATGVESREANQELFLFTRIDGDWKIARYAFSTTNPPAALA